MALIEKISRSVDNISADLDEKGQQRTHERLETLSAASSAWPDRVARLSETLTGSHGSSALALQSLALASERAASEPSWKRVAMPALESMTSCTALSARRKSFRGVEALRPAVRALENRSREVTESVRSARSTTQRLGDQVERVDREGLQLFGAPKLPDYNSAKQSPPPSR